MNNIISPRNNFFPSEWICMFTTQKKNIIYYFLNIFFYCSLWRRQGCFYIYNLLKKIALEQWVFNQGRNFTVSRVVVIQQNGIFSTLCTNCKIAVFEIFDEDFCEGKNNLLNNDEKGNGEKQVRPTTLEQIKTLIL